MRPADWEFLAYLRDQEVLSAAQLHELQRTRGAGSRTLRQSLLEAKLLDESSFLAHWAQMKGVTVLTAAELVPDAEAFEKIAPDYCGSHSVLPLRVVEGALVIAMSDPTDRLTLDDLRFLTNMSIEPRPALKADVAAALERMGASPIPELEDSPEEESLVVREVRRILDEALDSGATHVHLEPRETEVVVLHRIEGALKEVRRIPTALQAGLTARFKILGELDIA
jgi:type IV pilus assembly protein PilB